MGHGDLNDDGDSIVSLLLHRDACYLAVLAIKILWIHAFQNGDKAAEY